MKVLITGANGFTGMFLAREYKLLGAEVVGLVQRSHPEVEADSVFEANLLDRVRLLSVIQAVRPDYVVHLAAISFVAHGNVDEIYRTNVVGTRNLLQALLDADVKAKGVLLASTANIYGNASVEVIDESVSPSPANDYAVSKLAMEYVARLYADRLPIIVTRPFNYTGVGQADNFLLPKIVDHFRRRASVIELGNLDVARDFSDVRMVANCYRRLLETQGAVGSIFNTCSGRAHSLMDVLRMAEKITGHSMEVRVNPAFVRANEVHVLRGSRVRLEAAIGSVADYPLEETLRWMLEA
ncbi:NAD-dependent epimerase/dehydratase family protein [Ferribacterium limneticum]|uniref:NAD-dependent epimerase/dehydratase family protein n=1 Tax=Ferribacterium limneticum TaxID=76259 RepID=UPI001CF96C6B|nr:NAD-dependent epimerase/dehydratase family protein [Ferribacterium limneticum]UCV20758.1 NAD-dependent epimerase/dehydratase family protein [Ferribacterium limneticum]